MSTLFAMTFAQDAADPRVEALKDVAAAQLQSNADLTMCLVVKEGYTIGSGNVLLGECSVAGQRAEWKIEEGNTVVMITKDAKDEDTGTTHLCLSAALGDAQNPIVVLEKCGDGLIKQDWTFTPEKRIIVKNLDKYAELCLSSHAGGSGINSSIDLVPCEPGDGDQEISANQIWNPNRLPESEKN